MSETRSRAGSSQNRTDTMIGAGMRIEGDIAFAGVLRVQGDVIGNVACEGDAGDTVVVDATGSVAGTVGAPRIVVRGRVLGPLHSAQSIDIQQGGSVVGDAFYKQISIHAGGVVEGALMPALPVDAARSEPAPQADAPDLPPFAADATPAAGGESFVTRFGGWGALGGTAMLAVAVAAGMWMSRPPAKPAPRAAAAAAPLSAPPAAQAATPAPAANADDRAPAQPAPPPPAAGAEEVVTVHGVNPAKPAGAFLLIGREPAVLYRKKREESGEVTRLVVQQGKTISVAIGRNELFRVAEGRDLDIFYQGRKVTPKAIEGGAWMSFVPQGARAAGEDRQEESEDGAAR